MDIAKLCLLLAILKGYKNDALASYLDYNKSKLKSTTRHLIRDGLLKKDGDDVFLTVNGFNTLCHELYDKNSYQAKYKTRDGNAYFDYKNDTIKNDVIFLPDFAFDAASNRLKEGYKYRLYKTKFELNNLDLKILDGLESLIKSETSEKRGGFWLLKSKNRKFCGHGIKNFFVALKKLKNNFNFKIVYSSNAYIIILDSNSSKEKIKNIIFTFYLNNWAEMPYIDTLMRIEREMRYFLKFVGIEKIPKGNEIILDNSPSKIFV